MTKNPSAKVSPLQTTSNANWFSKLRPVSKFFLVELGFYLAVAGIGVIKCVFNA